MFEDDSEFAGKPTDALRRLATDVRASVVLRGRAVLEIGRRAPSDPALADDLLAWAADPAFQRTRWVGAATLGWIAAAAAGYSQHDPDVRRRLRDVLLTWNPDETRTLISWASREPWFHDMDDLSRPR